MTQIFNIINNLQKEDAAQNAIPERINMSEYLTKKEWTDLFIQEFENNLLKIGKKPEFEVVESQKTILSELKLWAFMDTECKYELNKGFFIVGGFGVGKSIILETFCTLYNKVSSSLRKKGIKITNCYEWVSDKQLLTYKGFLFIDDIGKEPNLIKDYGTETKPMAMSLYLRSRLNTYTFATANYDLKTISEKYGGSIADRFKEMFNIIELKGQSKR